MPHKENAYTANATNDFTLFEGKATLPNIPLSERVINMKAMVYVAQHNIGFSVVPEILQLTKALAADKKALDSLGISRTTYKTRFSLAKTFGSQLVETLKNTFFHLTWMKARALIFRR